MKCIALYATIIGFVGYSAVAHSQTTDPCDGVSCSNHGTCVLKAGDPVCACHEGYIPDVTTGLSCIPMEIEGTSTPEEAEPDTDGDENDLEQDEDDDAYTEVPVSYWARYKLGNVHMNSRQLKAFLVEQPSSAEIALKSKRLYDGGLSMLIIGIAAVAAGSIMFSVGIDAEPSDHPVWISGAGLFVVGVVVGLVGYFSLIPRSWWYLSGAVEAYNEASPTLPILPAYGDDDE